MVDTVCEVWLTNSMTKNTTVQITTNNGGRIAGTIHHYEGPSFPLWLNVGNDVILIPAHRLTSVVEA